MTIIGRVAITQVTTVFFIELASGMELVFWQIWRSLCGAM
jgi:hypothetical protein